MMDLPEHDENQTVPTGANRTQLSQRAVPPQQTVPTRAVPQPTVQNRAVQAPHQQQPVVPRPQPHAPQPTISNRAKSMPRPQPNRTPQMTVPTNSLPPRTSDPKARGKRPPYLMIGVLAVFVSTVLIGLVFLLIGMAALGSDQILPGVRVAGINVGGLSVDEAAEKLARRFPILLLTDGTTDRQWQVEPQRLGISIDARASASRAYGYGRDSGNFISGLLGAEIVPAMVFDPDAARAGLESLANDITQPAVNAGIALENGQVRTTPARDGRAVDLDGTVAVLASDPVGWLTHGEIPLKMVAISPSITDASPMVAAAQQLLASPLTIDVFDPATGAIVQWTAAPESWAGWLRAESDSASSTGLRLSLDETAVRSFVSQGEAQLSGTQYLDTDELVADMQEAVRSMNTRLTARVYHRDTQYVVQSGETIISIAWDHGVPYPWIQQANGGIQYVNAGQTITIPSVDKFLQYEPVKDKRIVVSISEQRVRVYEYGQLKWDWVASTGIQSSPTWPGIYQIISHYPNAYAGNWNLWMPEFMGVYQPIPGSDFTNGFHGFPTRGGGQILWENSLGTKVTYGCILLSNQNAKTLYDWAEEGVVVEIRA